MSVSLRIFPRDRLLGEQEDSSVHPRQRCGSHAVPLTVCIKERPLPTNSRRSRGFRTVNHSCHLRGEGDGITNKFPVVTSDVHLDHNKDLFFNESVRRMMFIYDVYKCILTAFDSLRHY